MVSGKCIFPSGDTKVMILRGRTLLCVVIATLVMAFGAVTRADQRQPVELPPSATEGTVVRLLQELDSQVPEDLSDEERAAEITRRNWRKVDLTDAFLKRWPYAAQRNDVLMIKLAALAELAPEDESALDALIELTTKIATNEPSPKLDAENAFYGLRAYELDSLRKKTPESERERGLIARYEAYLREYPASNRNPEIYAALIKTQIDSGDLAGAGQSLGRFGEKVGPTPEVIDAQESLLKALGLNKPFYGEFVTSSGETIRTSDLEGNAIVMHFWSADVSKSLGDTPRMLRIFTWYFQHNLKVLGISVDRDRKKIDNAMKSFKTPFPQCVKINKVTIDGIDVPIVAPTFLVVDVAGKLQASGRNAELERFAESLSQRRP